MQYIIPCDINALFIKPTTWQYQRLISDQVPPGPVICRTKRSPPLHSDLENVVLCKQISDLNVVMSR